jgi:hypothetical protein
MLNSLPFVFCQFYRPTIGWCVRNFSGRFHLADDIRVENYLTFEKAQLKSAFCN